jgi:acetyl-CoA carboxylase biotin carboxyl carrier protein
VRRRVEATWREAEGGAARLASPVVGVFHPALAAGAIVRPGDVLGRIEVLGHDAEVIAPAGTRGAVVAIAGGGKTARAPVDHGAALYELDPSASAIAASATTSAAEAAAHAAGGLVFAAPTSGRYYGKPGPGKPPFVSAGDEIAVGHTVCLLEVMKTFNRVTYGGPGLPARARVAALLVADESDVDSGTPLLRLEPIA